MLSDERLTKIEALVCASLNEDGAPAKVWVPCFLVPSLVHYFSCCSLKGGIAAVNARVYAVKVNMVPLSGHSMLDSTAIT